MTTRLVQRIPSPVYAETALSGTRLFYDTGAGYDYAVGGFPFNSAATRERPIVRRTADTQKQQNDTSREPGEHSLAFWWLRSQSSFHGGAGQRYLGSADTSSDDISRYRYWDSKGVDVFSEPGSATLLQGTYRLVSTPGATPLITTTDDGNLVVANGSSLTRYYYTTSVQTAAISWGATAPILSLTCDGRNYFFATNEGVYAGDSTFGAVTRIYNLGTGAKPLLRYVKQRLILGLDNTATPSQVYELDPQAAANSPLPVPIFGATRGWHWTALAETPSSILMSGHNGARSAVYKMSLDTSGTVPILSPGTIAVELPPLELVTGITTYLGTVVGMQTTEGFRVGVLSDSGDFTYGPLLFDHTVGQPHAAIMGLGNSLYAGYTDTEGVAGLARIDLTNTIGSGQSLRFPWAPDLYAAGSAAGAVTQTGLWDATQQFRVFVVAGVGIYCTTVARVPSGSVTTSRIRWDTLEPKLVRFARLRGNGDSGTVSLEVGKDSDVILSSVTTVDLSQRNDSGDVYVVLDSGQFFTAKVTLTGGATFAGYQLKAVPAQRRQRLVTIPLACYDREVSNTGQVLGQGSAMSRLLDLESLEQSGEIVTLQWLSVFAEERLTEYVVIEGLEFSQTATASDNYGWGGVISLTVRTVE